MRHSLRYLLLILLAFTMWTGSAKAQEGFGLQLVKLGSPVAEVGGFMDYSIFVSVNNPAGFCFNGFFNCSVELEDQLPAGFIPDLANIVAIKHFALFPPVPVPCSVTPGNLLTCELADAFALGNSFFPTEFVEVLIPGTAPNVEGIITNTASVEAVSGITNLGSANDSFDTNVVGPGPQANLAVFKTDSPDPVIGGQPLTYSVTVVNQGPDPATGVVIRDLLPPEVTFVSSDSPCNEMPPASNRFTCPIGAMIPGGIATVNITVTPDVLPGEVSVLNIARVFANQADPEPSDNIVAEATTIIPPGPDITESDLVITKTSPETVIQGQQFFYTVHVFNAGPDVADNVRFRDAPFMNTIINIPGIISTAPANCAALPMAPNFRCDLQNPLPSGQSVTFIVPATYNGPLPIDPLPIFNVANAILGPSNTPNTVQTDPVPENNTFVNVTNVVPVPPFVTESDLIVTKTSPDTVIAGVNYIYTSHIFNAGPDTAVDVVFRDALPTGVTFLSAATTGGGVCGPTINGFSCTGIAPIPPGQSVIVNARVRYDGPLPFEPLPIFNVANAELGTSNLPNTVQVDPIPENNTDVRVTNVISPPPVITESDLVITKSVPDVIIQGEQFGYFIQVVNLGPDTAQNVIVRDVIPDDVVFDTVPPGCSIVVNAPPVSDEMECLLGDLLNGEEVILPWRARYTGVVPNLPLFRPVFNLATVDFGLRPGNQIDPETSNNTDVAIARAIEPPPNINFVDLFVVKIDSPDPVVVEEQLMYNVYVYNFGPSDAVDVVLTDTLPASVTNINAPDCNPPALNVFTCNIPLIPANGGVVIIPITVDAPADTGMILNAAQAFVNPFALLASENTIQIDFAPSNNTDSEKTTVVPVPPPMSDLLILKTDTPDPIIEDDLLTYTIFVKNTGPDPAFGVLVSDWLPKEGLDLNTVEFTFSPNVAGCIQDPDILGEPFKVECVIPSLGVEESATINIKVQTLPLPDGVEFLNIFNLAKVESEGDGIDPPSADPNPLNNVVVESTLIGEFVPLADLVIIKSDSPDPVHVGLTLTYVLFVSNAGPDPATGVIITDTLPASVNFVSATPDQGNCGAPVGNVLTCNLGDLGVGEFTQVTVLVTPTVPGTILNVAQVTGNEHDPNSSNNISPQTTTVISIPTAPPDDPPGPTGNDLFVLKFVSPNPAEVGDEIIYTIIVGNNGAFSSGGTLVDTLPSGVTLLSANIINTGEACPSAGNQVTCALESIPPIGTGQVITIEIVVRADQTGSIANLAFIDGGNDPIGTNNVSIAASSITSQATNPPPTNPPPTNPPPTNPGDVGGNNDSGNSGCTLAAGKVEPGNSALNSAILLLPLFVFGIRTLRRKK